VTVGSKSAAYCPLLTNYQFTFMSEIKVPILSEMLATGESPEILFWVGCSGSFDDRAKKITKAIVRILNHVNIKFAILGAEESCNGDPAKRAGNEFLFQMQAMQNITTLNGYNIKKIVTGCPHCFNTLKNEYPALGGHYEVIHHTQLVQQLIDEGKLKVNGGAFKGKKIVYHDPCYLGRGNDIYEAPREVISKLDAELAEMKRSRAKGFCCGAGGAQLFKESEKPYKEPANGEKEVNNERTREALALDPDVIAVACPFCNTMMTDGVKHFNKEDKTKVWDVAELIANANDL
jgi:heterodisulfide reductase subunit D